VEPRFENKAVLQRVERPWRAFAFTTLIAVAIGFFIVFLFIQADPRYHSVQSYAIGALVGVSVNTWSLLGQLAVFRIVKPRSWLPTLLCRFLPFFAGGGLGVFTGSFLLGGPGGVGATDLLGPEQAVGFGAMSVVIGAVYEVIETLKERLRASVARAKDQEFAERELQAARSLQRRLLPRNEVEGEGYRIAARNIPSLVVSGDFYDVFAVGSGRVCFAVGDVAGKGMAAGLIMASVKAMLPLLAAENGVADTLRAINRSLFESLASREFVALCLGCFDPSSGQLHLANSGLPDVYLLSGAGEKLETLSVPGPRLPLGMRAEVAYEELKVSVRPGTCVLVMTDGLPEAVTSSGEPLGYEALEELLSAEPPSDALSWIDSLFGAVRTQTSDVADDDWTALVLDVRQ